MTACCQRRQPAATVPKNGIVLDAREAGGTMGSAARCRTIYTRALHSLAIGMTRPLKPLRDDQHIRFTRDVQWSCGEHWTHWGCFGVEAGVDEIRVRKLRPYPLPPEWEEVFSSRRIFRPLLCGDRAMASKWIKAAVARRAKTKPGQLPAEAWLCSGRPAMQDFLCELEGADGGVREPSALMIVLTAEGVRAGLKDDDAGGWCWREAPDLAAALDSIEKALQAGEGAFRGPRPQRKQPRR